MVAVVLHGPDPWAWFPNLGRNPLICRSVFQGGFFARMDRPNSSPGFSVLNPSHRVP